MSKLTPQQKAKILYDEGVEFISGKWYFRGREILEEDKFFLREENLSVRGLFPSVRELQNTKDFFIAAYGIRGDWKPLPIIKEAKALKALKPLAFPLNENQLIIINYLLRHDEEIFFIITGIGGSGKSTFINIIKQIFDNDYASLSLSDLSDGFKLATGVTHRLICSDEVNSDDLNNANLKQIISGQPITVNPKHEKPYVSRFQSGFIFNCNIPPRLDLSDSGMMRRILYYSMNEKIKNPNPALNRATWERADLVNIVAHALAVDMTNWKDRFQKDTRYYLVKYNSVYLLKDKSTYKGYKEGCSEKGYKAYSEIKWLEIRELLTDWGFIKSEDRQRIDEVF